LIDTILELMSAPGHSRRFCPVSASAGLREGGRWCIRVARSQATST